MDSETAGAGAAGAGAVEAIESGPRLRRGQVARYDRQGSTYVGVIVKVDGEVARIRPAIMACKPTLGPGGAQEQERHIDAVVNSGPDVRVSVGDVTVLMG